jgi:PAS domain S-box-containing protein
MIIPEHFLSFLFGSLLHFRTLADASPDTILEIGADLRFLYANNRALDVLGVPAATIPGKTPAELGLPEPVCALFEKITAETLRLGGTFEREFELLTAAGNRFFSMRAAPCMELPGRAPSVVATIRDTTAHHHGDMRLEEASQRLVHHANNSPLAVVEFDCEGRCLSWNHKAEEMFGHSQPPGDDRTASLLLSFLYPEDRGRFEEVYHRLRAGGEVSSFVTSRFIGHDGKVSFGEWYLSSLLDSDGSPLSILCFINDVTDREKALVSLGRMKEELEETVAQRTAMLRRTAEELHAEIDTRRRLERDLVAISEREHRRIGHDLHDGICQELAGIRFSIEAMSKARMKKAALALQLAETAAAVARAIHQTRLLSRGLAPLALQDGGLDIALEELAANSASLFQIDCAFRLKGHLPPFDEDAATNLFRIAQESIQNATKHGAATKIRVLLDCAGPEGILTVTDNGNGLPPTPLPHPNNGGNGHSNGNGHGGMGMKIMRHRAELLGGTVRVISAKGGGACVHCVFRKP